MYYYRYRKNGGEVLGISLDDIWSDSTYIGVFSTGVEFPISPPAWCDGSTIRSATQGEIDDFPVCEAEDRILEQRSDSKDVIDGTDKYKTSVPRALRALVLLILQEINTLRALHSLPEYTKAQLVTALKNKIDEENGS